MLLPEFFGPDVSSRGEEHMFPLIPADRNRNRLPEFVAIPHDDKFDSSRAFRRNTEAIDPAIRREAVG